MRGGPKILLRLPPLCKNYYVRDRYYLRPAIQLFGLLADRRSWIECRRSGPTVWISRQRLATY